MGSKLGAFKRWNRKYPEGILQRFNAKINITEYCWLWTGTTTGKNHGEYGTFWNGAEIITAHRFSLEQKLGRKLKEGMKALHQCDISLCVNPNHLYEGTQTDNLYDAYRRNRRSGEAQNKMLLLARKKKLGY